nr:MAG TPA: hypothetical protein [Caudoviricetes sp.]
MSLQVRSCYVLHRKHRYRRLIGSFLHCTLQ